VRTLVLLLALVLGACASTSGLPVQPFNDIPIPVQWTPYSRDWVMIQTAKVTAAKMVYFAETPVNVTLEHARQLMARTGWTETRSERFVNPEKFPGVWAEFSKGEDICRVTVIEAPFATHIDYTVARINRPQ
jgi:hypothetical protein